MSDSGQLIVISAPSGTGKSTVINAIKGRIDKIGYSVSHTSRAPRQGEVNGIDYFFVSEPEFERMISEDAFVEWAKVYNAYYGTSFSALRQNMAEGFDIILDIDFQGAAAIRKHFTNSILIFLVPPNLETLKARLIHRGKDSESVIMSRMALAEDNLRHCSWYDYIVVNDNLEKAVAEVCSIIIAGRRRAARMLLDESLKSNLKFLNT